MTDFLAAACANNERYTIKRVRNATNACWAWDVYVMVNGQMVFDRKFYQLVLAKRYVKSLA